MHLAMKDKELVGQAAASISLTFLYTFDKVEAKVSNCDSGLLQNQARKKAHTTRTSSIFRGLPERHASSTTIEMLPCHRVRLLNALPNGLGQLLLHAPTLLVTWV